MNAQDDYGLTALHCAADRGNYPAVLELLKINSVLVNLRGNDNFSTSTFYFQTNLSMNELVNQLGDYLQKSGAN